MHASDFGAFHQPPLFLAYRLQILRLPRESEFYAVTLKLSHGNGSHDSGEGLSRLIVDRQLVKSFSCRQPLRQGGRRAQFAVPVFLFRTQEILA